MIDLLMIILVVSIVGCGNYNVELQPQADQEAIVQEDIFSAAKWRVTVILLMILK
ncbi:MAG: hypothetical protein OSJ73_11115 [Lachnospiraceae bacterium]|nr:hypothetical protein [Lachnospiraceae bacterium]